MQISRESVSRVCLTLVETKIHTLQAQMEELKVGIAADGKSSSGDKHETSRAMAHLEQEQLAAQLGVLQEQHLVIQKLRQLTLTEHIAAGSLVRTDQGYFYLSTALGRIESDDEIIIALSPQSPLGKLFVGKRMNDVVSFSGRVYRIEEVG